VIISHIRAICLRLSPLRSGCGRSASFLGLIFKKSFIFGKVAFFLLIGGLARLSKNHYRAQVASTTATYFKLTLRRVARLITERFGFKTSLSEVWRLLRRWGWSPTKPLRRVREWDEAKNLIEAACYEVFGKLSSTLLSWGISGLEARWPHRLEACATGNLTK
jgi:hypothetical protein